MVSKYISKEETSWKICFMFPKDREAITKQSNIIYWFKFGRTECDNEYIGESARTFEERYKEHLKALSPIFEHQNITCHTATVVKFRIIAREVQNMARVIKEAIYIRVNNPTLNRNIGKDNMPHIWNEVLFPNPRTKNQISKPQRYNICVLWRSTSNKDLCTVTYVP